MSFICLKLMCSFSSQNKIQAHPHGLWGRMWLDSCLSHLILYPSPPPRSNLSTLSLFHLSCSVHTDFSVSWTQGHHVWMCRLCTVEPQEGHSVDCRVNDAPWKCAVWQPSLYTELFPLARSWYLLVLLPGISIYTVGSFLLSTGQIFHKTPLSTKQNWLHNLESPMQNKNKLSFSLNVTFPEGSFLTTPPR